MNKKFEFNISLSVLNHLGRNLYRNMVTIIGEAISNAWDADAKNVRIFVNKEDNNMYIIDDGEGMSEEDFQNKFLKVGYSKRNNDKDNFTKSGRPFIGRKGIGKLALLSCAKRVHILTKTTNIDITGGVIDNSSLDEEIKKNGEKYILENYSESLKAKMDGMSSGTLIYFEAINDGVKNTIDFLRKAIALNFKFSLLDDSFNIYLNDKIVNEEDLCELANATQFLWIINESNDSYLKTLRALKKTKTLSSNLNISGYVASVNKPSDRSVRGANEKVTIDLFVNGRLREKDILRHIPSSRIVENYVYGQIHFNDLDRDGSPDIFTSSREGIIPESEEYKKFLEEFDRIFKIVIERWDKYRLQNGNEGDSENKRLTLKDRRTLGLFNATIDEIDTEKKLRKKGSVLDQWIKKLSVEARYNVPSYMECFIAENLLRNYIKYKKLPVTGKGALDEIKKCQDREKDSKRNANIHFSIRVNPDNLSYLSMNNLAIIIDEKEDRNLRVGFVGSAIVYKPMRDAMAHTSILTEKSKQRLTSEYENIKGHLAELLEEIDD